MSPAQPPWEAYLADHFPAYLLPHAVRRALPREAAASFLERTSGDPRRLFLLRAASAIAGQERDLSELAFFELPRLARGLPPRTVTAARVSDGPIEGRIDVAATLKHRLSGSVGRTVTRAPIRGLHRPENVLLASVTRRLVEVTSTLRASGLLVEGGSFGDGLIAASDALARLLATTPLGAIPDAPITIDHERAALGARGRGYALAASLHRTLREALDEDRPEAIARILAEGALLPLTEAVRFELAVLIRLMQGVWERLDARHPGRFLLHRTAILRDRCDVADFERDDGAHLRIFYNQAFLGPGPSDLGARHYFGRDARMRPDITIVVDAARSSPRAAVVEAKLSSDPDYLAQGYRQALLYRHEYASRMTGWPKAILVGSSFIPGAPRREDDVIAVGWDRWVPEVVLDGLLDGLCGAE